MTTFETIQKLAESRKISVKELSRKLGFGESTIYRWKKQEPKAIDLEKVADYFDVSVDYLLGRNDKLQNEEPSMAKQVMMRMDTAGISEKELEEIESEMERFFSWRIEEIKREKDE